MATTAPQAAAMRRAITDRLGLPENASNGAILAAYDARQAPNIAPARVDPAEALYALAWGSDTEKPGTNPSGLSSSEAEAFTAAGWAA